MTLTASRPRLRPHNVAPLAQPAPWPLHVLGEPKFAFVVYGEPGPQGSKSFKGMRTSKKTGKSNPVLVESSKKVAPWREKVATIASDATGYPFDYELLVGALVCDMVFTLAPPARFPKNKPWDLRWLHRMVTSYPDVSKLARSTEDAMSKIVWHDDSHVVGYRRLHKVYVGTDDPDALREPGAVIRVWELS